MPSLIAHAQTHGLLECARLIEKMQLVEPAAPDKALAAPITNDPLVALALLRRRSLEPHLVEVMWKWFQNRPVELGLFAWDVLCGALLDEKHDQLLIGRLRKAARVVRDVLPEPGRAFVDTSRVSAAMIVDKIALPAFLAMSDREQFAAANVNALAGIEVQVATSESGDPELTKAVTTARTFAHYLQLAHLPTLATFYFNYLWKRAGMKEVLGDYVDGMVDANAYGHYPSRDEVLVQGTLEEAELIGYMLGRSSVQLGTYLMANDFRNAPNPLDYKKGAPSELAKTWQRSHLVHAELMLESDEFPVPLEVIEEVVRLNPTWRYAGRVRLALLSRLAKLDSDQPLRVLDDFVSTFGNERWAWQEMEEYTPVGASWIAGFNARLVREVTSLPHDRTAWEALGIVELLSDDMQVWLKDIKARAAAQCEL